MGLAARGRQCDLPHILAGAVAGVGGAIAIGAMEWFSVAAHYPLAVIPFATSCRIFCRVFQLLQSHT
jgi:hypothetical protein